MFIVIGVLGIVLFGIAFVFDDVLDAVIPQTDWLSTAAIAAFMAAFGFVAALLQWRVGFDSGPAAVGGMFAGVGLGVVAVRFSRSLSSMATDATPTAGDLIGCSGRVVTPVLTDGAGEVLVHLGGQPMKLSALGPDNRPTAEPKSPLFDTGTEIVVIEVLSPTRVRVEAADTFWT